MAELQAYHLLICGIYMFLPTFRRFHDYYLRNVYLNGHIPQILPEYSAESIPKYPHSADQLSESIQSLITINSNAASNDLF